MDVERIRKFLLTLRFAEETCRDGKLVYWVGAKVLGGKMFALLEIENQRTNGRERAPLISFSAGELYEELLNQQQFVKAPYLARARWVAVPLSSPTTFKQMTDLLRKAHEITESKLPPNTKAHLWPGGKQKGKVG